MAKTLTHFDDMHKPECEKRAAQALRIKCPTKRKSLTRPLSWCRVLSQIEEKHIMEKLIVVEADDGAPDSTLTRLEHLLPSGSAVPPLDPEDEAIVREITGGDYAYLS